jgi:hypothetical protein
MSVIEETRTLHKDLIALELREISARLNAHEKRMAAPFDLNDQWASDRHDQLMRAIAHLADTRGLYKRITRIEARERAS